MAALVQANACVTFFLLAIWSSGTYYPWRFSLTGMVLAVTTLFTGAFALAPE